MDEDNFDEELDNEDLADLDDEQANEEQLDDEETDEETEELEEVDIGTEAKSIITRLKQKLKNIKSRLENLKVSLFPPPKYTKEEKKIIESAKNFKELKNDITAVKQEKTKKNLLCIKTIFPFLGQILLVIGIIFLIFIIAMSVSAGFGSKFPSSDNASQSSIDGITGKDFYGARLIYKDEEKSKLDTINDYVGIVSATIDNLENSTLDITLEMPTINSNFNEQNFSTENSQIYTFLQDLAEIVYISDNPEQAVPPSLMEKASGIKYFGINNAINTSFAEKISTYINTYNLYAQIGTELPEAEIENIITNSVKTFVENSYQKRTEKLYVKDYILQNDDDSLSNIPQQNYVAMIYFPKQSTTFNKVSFLLNLAENQDVEITLNDLTFNKNFEANDDSLYTWTYVPTTNVNIPVPIYQGFDNENAEYCKTEKSLYDLLLNYKPESLIATETDENILTFNAEGCVVKLNSSQKFYFSEYEVKTNN